MQLDLITSIEKQLKTIVDDAIASGKIQTDQLRMIIISPNKTFDILKVSYNNEWDDYYYESEYNDAGEIGYINIHSWLDIADQAFENRKEIADHYIEKAKKYGHKYSKLKPVLCFDHIQEEPYKSFLICLREELLLQITNAISKVATSYDQNTFQNVVGFVAYKLVFEKGGDGDNRIIAFNHPNGAGPFYNVRLTLPKFKSTYPYLKFYESGFHLFYPKSNIYEGPEKENHIYTYDINDFTYGIKRSNTKEKAIFRLHDEFEDWKLSGGHIEEEEGDFSETDFYEAYNSFLSKFPDKNLDANTIPDPIARPTEFQKWLDIMVTNNLAITYDHKNSIYEYGEEAYQKALQLLPETHQSYTGFKKFLSSELYDQSRYEEALKVMNTIKNLSDHEKTHVLEILYFLDQREEFETIFNELENKNAKNDALLINWLFGIKLHSDDSQKILELKEEITEYLKGKINYDAANRGKIALMKIYSILNEQEKAALLFSQLDHPSDNLMSLFLKEFSGTPFILDLYEAYLLKEQEKKGFKLWLEKPTLIIPDIDKKEIATVLFKDCYYPTHKIQDIHLKWAVPIAPFTFIAVNDDAQLFLGEITNDYEIIKHQVIQLDKEASYSYGYSNEIIYIADYNKGIFRYSVQDNLITELKEIIKNKQAATRYKSMTVSDGFLYACNDGYLEIFDLSVPSNEPISSELYIDNAFSLHAHNDVLLTEPSSRILVLIDIQDKTNPTYLSSIKDERTYGNKHFEFIENYVIGGVVIDITDAKSPQYICHTWDEVAPIFYFSEKPKIPLYSTGDEHLFKTLVTDDNGKISVSNWLEYINKENLYYERLTSNLATMYNGDTVIGYTPYDICILEKGKNPKYQKKQFNIQPVIEKMVFDCFAHIIDSHPDFMLGKVVLNEDYGTISISFQECSSIAINIDTFDEPELPIIHSNLSVYGYFRDVYDAEYNNQTMQIQYDLEIIIKKLIANPDFNRIVSKHVAIIINNKSQYLHFPDRKWNPYRTSITIEVPSTVKNILLSRNENLIKKLSIDMVSNDEITEELIQILNLGPIEEQQTDKNGITLNNKTISEVNHSQENKTAYEVEPTSNMKEETLDLDALKHEAFRVIVSHPDKTLVKNIILNGATYGIPKPHLNEVPDHYTPRPVYVEILVKNWYGLWDEFSEEPDIKTFLLNSIDGIEDENVKALLAYRYELFTHPAIQNYIRHFFTDAYERLDYYRYTQGDINISKLPEAAIRPFEDLCLKIVHTFENREKDDLDRKTKEMIIPVCDMLQKLGHEIFPEKLLDQVTVAKKNNEQYDDDLFGDDDYENEETFLLKLYRNIQVKKLMLRFHSDKDQPIWDINIAPEPFKKSWHHTFDVLLAKGEEIYGVDFRNVFIQKLSDNIAKDECYDHDRLMAFHFIHYTYKHIQKRPELASLAEKIVTAIQKNKEKFSEEIDLYKIKEESKYALLQSAWNDLKNKDWDLAEKKSNAIIKIDPHFGQVYFLQARLLWLKEGIPAYLAQKDEFIKKASHDAAALSRLYNLTGCALDVEKRYEESLPYFKNAALTATNEPMYLANIAEIYYKLENAAEALNYVEKAKQNGHSSEMMDEIIQNKGIINLKNTKNEN